MLDQSTDTVTITKARYYELRCAEVLWGEVSLGLFLDGPPIDEKSLALQAEIRTNIRKEIFGEEAPP